ncbi:hypothetical protein [Azoarcus sp. DN11]|uniref:hypothetical protein n=1 Tax=Azoarcus sp. DN11 TaxID=356837 RepID=UPI000EAC65CA|nr:hypothetical protein [Azoarcus sp. DN11]AYH42478.1 hypothetical protein CDA09_03595 [Azoarcus sp. DN11]
MNMRLFAGITALMLLLSSMGARAEIAVDGNWRSEPGVPLEQWEGSRLEAATLATAIALSATSAGKKAASRRPELDLGFRLYIEGTKYYVKPALFMAKDRPDEVCTPASFTRAPTYQCEEGQRYKVSCHLMFFNAQLENIGVYRFRPQEGYETYCNAVLAMGVADKERNELFVTFQYFPIDRPAARAANEVGKGWTRMTSLLRLTLADGRISVAEDGACIPNPNALETIPDARVALKRCRGTEATKQRK